MIIDPNTRSSGELYRLMISSVLPRPIAWVSSVHTDGTVNIAPFSYFQIVGSNPPMVSICIGQRRWNGEHTDKDTLRNIKHTGELVVNIASDDDMAILNQSSAEYAPHTSEALALDIATEPSDLVKPPRIAQSPIHFECKLDRTIALGNAPQVTMVIAEVVRFHIADRVWDADKGSIDPQALRPLARLGGTMYASVGGITDLARPKSPEPEGK